MPTTISTSAIEFFYANAGWSWNPATETEDEGKRRSAIQLATAETWAKSANVVFIWEEDWDIDHASEFPDCYADGGPETCEQVTAYLDNEVIGSMGCVDDATAEYRRIVEAEVALEAMGTDPTA